jgi:branched-chain amino acid transport system substrate-binding protein
MKISRRTLLRSAAIGAAGVAAPSLITRYGWAQTGPIKLGMVEPMSGPNRYFGESRTDAVRLVVERVNAAGGLLGREAAFVAVDSEMKADVAARRARELLLGEKVDFITGFSSPVNMAVAREANAQKKLFVSSTTLPTDMNGSGFTPTTFTCSPNAEVYANGLVVLVKNSPAKKVYVLAQDVGSGVVMGKHFARQFAVQKRPDQELVGEEYHPTFRITDFGPYITKIIASGADWVVTPNFGPDLLLPLQQGSQLGWNVRVATTYLNDPVVLKELGAAAIGHWASAINLITIPTAKNKEWVKIWRDRYPKGQNLSAIPDSSTGMAVNAYSWMFDVVKRAGSIELDKLIKTWEGDKYTALWGDVEMRACDHLIQTGIGKAQIAAAADIPADMRFFDFPFIGPATLTPREEISIARAASGNSRCTA